MGTYTKTGATGEGSFMFAATTPVEIELDVVVTSFTVKQRVIGTMEPRGIWQAGEVFLGIGPGDVTGVTIPYFGWGFYIHYTAQTIQVPASRGLANGYSTVFWRLKPGVVINIEVDW